MMYSLASHLGASPIATEPDVQVRRETDLFLEQVEKSKGIASMDARHKPHNPRWIRPPGKKFSGVIPFLQSPVRDGVFYSSFFHDRARC